MGRSLDREALGLTGCGVEWDRKGVRVDQQLRTTADWVWAAGDVVGEPLFTLVVDLGWPVGRHL